MMGPIRLSLEEGLSLPTLLALPSTPQPAAGLRPVLCFLHGYDEGPPTRAEDGLTRHGPLRPGNPVQALGDFIVAAPQLPLRGDLWSRYSREVRQVVEEVRKEYGGDPARTYLTGFSFGGNGVFDLALLQPGFWTALWAVDPTRVPVRDPNLPVWLSFGDVARYNKSGFIHALDLKPVESGTDRIYLDEGEDHVGSATKAYRDERIYAWLLSRRQGEGA